QQRHGLARRRRRHRRSDEGIHGSDGDRGNDEPLVVPHTDLRSVINRGWRATVGGLHHTCSGATVLLTATSATWTRVLTSFASAATTPSVASAEAAGSYA